MTFGEKLRNLRRDHGYSQEVLSRLSGFSTKSIYNWEHEKSMPSDFIFTCKKLSEILQAPLSYWLDDVT